MRHDAMITCIRRHGMCYSYDRAIFGIIIPSSHSLGEISFSCRGSMSVIYVGAYLTCSDNESREGTGHSVRVSLFLIAEDMA